MGYIFDFNDAKAFDKWYLNPQNRLVADLECRLMIDMLRPKSGESALEIGCGTGISCLPLIDRGLQLTGLDPSPYMLDIAFGNVKNRVDLHRGFAEDLPFKDNQFNYAFFVSTLSFVDNHKKAIEEACRVAKDKVFIGLLSRYAINSALRKGGGKKLSQKGMLPEAYRYAKYYSVWELKQIFRSLLGNVPTSWRTIRYFPVGSGKKIHRIERFKLLQKFPFGSYAGIVVTLMPRFRTRPLPLKYSLKCAAGNSGNVLVG